MNSEHISWEYQTGNDLSVGELSELGRSGWELVSVEDHTFYLKRPSLNFRERVTMEQRAHYYARRDHGAPAEGATS